MLTCVVDRAVFSHRNDDSISMMKTTICEQEGDTEYSDKTAVPGSEFGLEPRFWIRIDGAPRYSAEYPRGTRSTEGYRGTPRDGTNGTVRCFVVVVLRRTVTDPFCPSRVTLYCERKGPMAVFIVQAS